MLLSPQGVFTVTATPLSGPCGLDLPSMSVDEAPVTTRLVHIDPEPTTPSVFTRTKTTHRPMYNDARVRVGLSPMPTPTDAHIDVLVHNAGGLVMETSIRNIAFRRGDQWVTPSTASGCLVGVVRRLMLEEYGIVEQDVYLNEVKRGEIVLTFNGVEGMQLAKIA